MRKVSSILLLSVFLMYHLGYYGIYLGGRYQLDKKWENIAEHEQFDADEIREASIPISIPYQADQPDYRPASGTVEIEGEFYRIVKQRYVKDTLRIQYVKDRSMEKLHDSFEDWLSSLTQKPISEKGSLQFWKVLAKDFLISTSDIIHPKVYEQEIRYGSFILPIYKLFCIIPSPPPRA